MEDSGWADPCSHSIPDETSRDSKPHAPLEENSLLNDWNVAKSRLVRTK